MSGMFHCVSCCYLTCLGIALMLLPSCSIAYCNKSIRTTGFSSLGSGNCLFLLSLPLLVCAPFPVALPLSNIQVLSLYYNKTCPFLLHHSEILLIYLIQWSDSRTNPHLHYGCCVFSHSFDLFFGTCHSLTLQLSDSHAHCMHFLAYFYLDSDSDVFSFGFVSDSDLDIGQYSLGIPCFHYIQPRCGVDDLVMDKYWQLWYDLIFVIGFRWYYLTSLYTVCVLVIHSSLLSLLPLLSIQVAWFFCSSCFHFLSCFPTCQPCCGVKFSLMVHHVFLDILKTHNHDLSPGVNESVAPCLWHSCENDIL